MVTKIKPYNPRAGDLVADWHVIDASGEVLGRLATRVAWLLMGKHKPGYVRHLSSGDFVVVVNADKVRTTGNKSQQIVYRRHSQYPGNLKEIPYQRVMETHPTRIIEHAVRGMLPKSKLGDRMYSRLKVYADETHPHMAQVTGSKRRIERMAAEAVQEAEEAVKTATQPARRRRRRTKAVAEAPEPVAAEAATTVEAAPDEATAEEAPKKPARRRRRAAKPAAEAATTAEAAPDEASAEEAPKRPARRRRRRRTRSAADAAAVAAGGTAAAPAAPEAPAAEVESSADATVEDGPSTQPTVDTGQDESGDEAATEDRTKEATGDA